jgi:hypothetical protein
VSLTTVTPVVRRHVDDLAFYWLQLDSPFPGADFDAEKASHFQELLLAHQEGVSVAGVEAVSIALDALERWRKPGEAFAAMFAALTLTDAQLRSNAIARVFATVQSLPDVLLRGVISALAYGPQTHVSAWLAEALREEQSVPLTAALRAAALLQLQLPHWQRYATHADRFVQLAAYRLPNAEVTVLQMQEGSGDVVLDAERVIAWARTTPLHARTPAATEVAASRLWRCIAEWMQAVDRATGGHRALALRRLDRWVRHLGGIMPLGHPNGMQALQRLPRRHALNLVLHHADPAHLPFVVACMQDPDVCRWAGWVWECLTGMDLEAEGLSLEDEVVVLDDPLTQARQDGDLGMARPDPARVAAHPATHLRLAPGHRLLRGEPVTESALLRLISAEQNQPQALRRLAAGFLRQLDARRYVNLRASPSVQWDQLAALRAPR